MGKPWLLLALLAGTLAVDIALDGPLRHTGPFPPTAAIALLVSLLFAYPHMAPDGPGRRLLQGSAALVLVAGVALCVYCVTSLARPGFYSGAQLLLLIGMHTALGISLVRETSRLIHDGPVVWQFLGTVAAVFIMYSIMVLDTKLERHASAGTRSADEAEAVRAFELMLANPLLHRRSVVAACLQLTRIPTEAGAAAVFRAITAREGSGWWPSDGCTRKVCERFASGDAGLPRHAMLEAYLGADWENKCAGRSG